MNLKHLSNAAFLAATVIPAFMVAPAIATEGHTPKQDNDCVDQEDVGIHAGGQQQQCQSQGQNQGQGQSQGIHGSGNSSSTSGAGASSSNDNNIDASSNTLVLPDAIDLPQIVLPEGSANVTTQYGSVSCSLSGAKGFGVSVGYIGFNFTDDAENLPEDCKAAFEAGTDGLSIAAINQALVSLPEEYQDAVLTAIVEQQLKRLGIPTITVERIENEQAMADPAKLVDAQEAANEVILEELNDKPPAPVKALW